MRVQRNLLNHSFYLDATVRLLRIFLATNKHEILRCLYFAGHKFICFDNHMLIFINSRARAVEESDYAIAYSYVFIGGGVRALCLPIFLKLQESWSKVGNSARELTTVFSVTFFSSSSRWSNDQYAPPTENVSAHP